MLPAGLQTLPEVAFHSRIRPSFPAEDRTVPVMFHSTLPTADLKARKLGKVTCKRKEQCSLLMMIKICNNARSPFSLRLPLFRLPTLIPRLDPPYPNVSISTSRGYKVIWTPTRRSPRHRNDCIWRRGILQIICGWSLCCHGWRYGWRCPFLRIGCGGRIEGQQCCRSAWRRQLYYLRIKY
jgi:hypothetical protein